LLLQLGVSFLFRLQFMITRNPVSLKLIILLFLIIVILIKIIITNSKLLSEITNENYPRIVSFILKRLSENYELYGRNFKTDNCEYKNK